ncbi:hypothetical protein AgCh_024362 [Apium graveolens]
MRIFADNPSSPRGLLLAGPGLKLRFDRNDGGMRCSSRVGTYKTEPEGGVLAAPPTASGRLGCVRVLSNPDCRNVLDPGYLGGGDAATCPGLFKKFSMWNPAIHQSKEFTFPPHLFHAYGFEFGLGFDRVSNNFKVVVLFADLRCATVYCSGSDSWSNVFVPENMVRLYSIIRECFLVMIT